MKSYFDHEKLTVYQEAVRFITWVMDLLETVPKSIAAHNQLERASTSIPLNIAEGNGKFTPADRCHYFDISRGSSLESAACLDVLHAKKAITADKVTEGKKILSPIVSMLTGLIKSNHPDRVYEDSVEYKTHQN
jgi:four helix bundle protein